MEPLSGGRWEAWPSSLALCSAFFTCVNARRHAKTCFLKNHPSKSTRSHQSSTVPLHLPHNEGHSLPRTGKRVRPSPHSRVPPSSATRSQLATTPPPDRTRVPSLSCLVRARPSSNRSAGSPRIAQTPIRPSTRAHLMWRTRVGPSRTPRGTISRRNRSKSLIDCGQTMFLWRRSRASSRDLYRQILIFRRASRAAGKWLAGLGVLSARHRLQVIRRGRVRQVSMDCILCSMVAFVSFDVLVIPCYSSS